MTETELRAKIRELMSAGFLPSGPPPDREAQDAGRRE